MAAKKKAPRRVVRKEPCQVCEGQVVTVDDPDYRNSRDAPAFQYCVSCATIFKCADSKVKKYDPKDYE